MTDRLDDLLAVATPDPVARKQRTHGDGWTPSVRGDDNGGEVVTPPRPEGVDRSYDDLLRDCGIDPELFEVIEPVLYNRWMQRPGEWLTQDKFKYQRRGASGTDVEALVKKIASHRYKRPTEVKETATSALVVCLADWQAGPDPHGLVEHILNLKNLVVDELKASKPDILYVIGMGDLVEGCGNSHYAMQDWTVAAGGMNGRRDQVKLVRRLLVDLLTEWARRTPRVVVGCVPGNHGENRRKGKAFTTLEDNDDLAVFEQAAEVMGANPDAYGHVRFVIPDGDMSLTLDIAGSTVGFIHGHQARRGGATPQQKLLTWWKEKGHGGHPIGDADVLVSGHFHHAVLVEDGPKTWMQAPAMAHSRWWEEAGGQPTKVGTLTFRVGPDGWDRYQLLR